MAEICVLGACQRPNLVGLRGESSLNNAVADAVTDKSWSFSCLSAQSQVGTLKKMRSRLLIASALGPRTSNVFSVVVQRSDGSESLVCARESDIVSSALWNDSGGAESVWNAWRDPFGAVSSSHDFCVC